MDWFRSADDGSEKRGTAYSVSNAPTHKGGSWRASGQSGLSLFFRGCRVMRVIGGEFRSRILKSLPGLDVRPTTDRLRETLFNILAPRIAGARFADVYAGTGAVGIEALSRGAARAIFVEQKAAACEVIRANLRALGLESRAMVRQAKASSALASIEADIIFLDPPYRLEGEYARCLEILSRKPPALAIVQHPSRMPLPPLLECARVITQGDNALSFFGKLRD